MDFQPKTITLKDGRSCVLRPATSEYAEDMIEYLRQTAGETPFLLRCPDEVSYTPESEREILDRIYADPGSVMMLALVDGRIAGNCYAGGDVSRRKQRHRCSMGIALYEEYWNLGAGTAMIEYLQQLAGQMGFEQINLEVVDDNVRAQALYKKCGFVESGRRHRAMRFDDGSYHDEIIMYMELR